MGSYRVPRFHVSKSQHLFLIIAAPSNTRMASKTLIIILAMALIAVTFAASLEFEDEEIEVEDLQEFFQMETMEKRGSKVGSKCSHVLVIECLQYCKSSIISHNRIQTPLILCTRPLVSPSIQNRFV